MKFTNIASFAAILVASVQAAEIKNDSPQVCILPGSISTKNNQSTGNATNSSVADQAKVAVNTVTASQSPAPSAAVDPTKPADNIVTTIQPQSETKAVGNTVTTSQNPGTTDIDLNAVTPESPVEHKIKKIMSLRLSNNEQLKKFGDLNQDLVQSFLKPEEWGRIDYHNNDDDLTSETLTQVISSPFSSLTIDQKAKRIMALTPKPQKMGDLKAEMVTGILTPEEWGKVDFYDNNAVATEDLIKTILNQP